MASIGGAYAAALLLLLLQLFAGVTLGASAQPAASSSSRCASLETACHDFWSAAECGVTKNCIPGWERLPAAPAPPGNDTELCAVCKQMVSEARAQLLSNETQSELRQVLQGSCRILLPFEPLQEVCAKIMDSFIDELDDVLVSRMDPDQVCQVSGLCWQSVSSAAAQADLFERVSHLLLARSGTAATAATTPAAVAAANSCAECKDTVDKAVGFIQFVPVDVLVRSFGVACIRSMKDVLKCDEMTYVYAQRFIQSFLLSTSDRTCRAFGKCGDGEAAAAAAAAASYIDRPAVGGPQPLEPLECEFCEAMVHRIAVRFNNTAAREQIKTALEIMCQRTGFWARECLERVENNFDQIYDKVINMLEPSVLCSLIGICRPDHTTPSIAPTTPSTTPTTETPSTPTTGTPTMPTTETPSTPTTETPSTATTETPSTPTTETPSASTADTTTTSGTPTTAAERHTMPLMPLTPARWNIAGSKPTPAQVKVDSKPCDVCRNTIGFLEHAVKNNASKETVETILSSVCYWYGINATACKKYVQTNIDKLFEMLQKDVDADKICIEMHLCGGNGLATRVSPANSGFCATCKDAVGLVMKELEDDNVKHGVETRLMTICDLAPVNVTQCQNLVFDAVEELFEALRRSISVETVCDKLHLCDQQFKTQGSLVAVGADNVFCKACRSVAEQLVGVINDDDAKDRVEAAIEKICELLPMDVATCQQFIDQKVGEAYAYMRARITVDNICFRGLHVCGGGGGLSVNGRSAVAGRRASCEVCSRMFEWLLDETRRNTSQAAILTAIRRVCMALPDHETAECRTLIGTYSVVFMNLVRDGVSTPEACETLGLCLQAPHASATASPFIAGSASFRSASRLRAREDLCGTCRSVTGWLLGELQNNKTDEAVRDGLRRVCSHVPGEPAADRCQSLVEAYEDPLSSFIEHGMSSDDACHAIGVCEARPPSPSPSPPAASHGNACELCTVVSTWLVGELKDNKTVDAIVFALEKVCTVLPVNKVECQNYIETYSHLLLQLLQEDLTPKEMCDVLGLCESNQLIPLPKAPQSVVCPLCERLISWLVERLGDNRTEQSILGELEKVCVVIPADRVRCENFVQVYGSELASLLATAAPTTVCVSLGVCGFWERPVAVLPMTCPLCTVVVDGIQQQLRSATVTKEEIMHAMENVCTYIPMDRTECQTAVNKYADVIVRLILEDSAQDVCSKMHACPPNAALSLGGYSNACPTCELVVRIVQVSLNDNDVRAGLVEMVERACQAVSSDPRSVTECRNAVDVYGRYVVDLLHTLASPRVVCHEIGFCAQPASCVKCDLCLLMARYVDATLERNSTEAEIVGTLQKACTYASARNKHVCLDLVHEIADMVISLLRENESPMQVCRDLHLCRHLPDSSAHVRRRVAALTASASNGVQLPSSMSEKCEMCKWIVEIVANKLANNETDEMIEHAFAQACNLVEHRDECRDMVHDYLDMVLKMFVEFASHSKDVCVALRECPPPPPPTPTLPPSPLSPPSRRPQNYVQLRIPPFDWALPASEERWNSNTGSDDVSRLLPMLRFGWSAERSLPNATCKVCRLAMRLIANDIRREESTDRDIVAAIESVCERVPSAYADHCRRLVETDGMVVLRLIGQSLGPDQVCDVIKYCPVSMNNGEDIVCAWCQYTLHFLQNILYDNKTEQEINHLLETMCAKIKNANLSKECTEFIDVYGPSLEVIIAQKLDPSVVCPAIRACPSAVNPSAHLSSNLPIGHPQYRQLGGPHHWRGRRPRPSTAQCGDCVATLAETRHRPIQTVCRSGVGAAAAVSQFRAKCEAVVRSVAPRISDALASDIEICQLSGVCKDFDGRFVCERSSCVYRPARSSA